MKAIAVNLLILFDESLNQNQPIAATNIPPATCFESAITSSATSTSSGCPNNSSAVSGSLSSITSMTKRLWLTGLALLSGHYLLR